MLAGQPIIVGVVSPPVTLSEGPLSIQLILASLRSTFHIYMRLCIPSVCTIFVVLLIASHIWAGIRGWRQDTQYRNLYVSLSL